MPMHDWTLVEDRIFHAFHHRWISAISDVLNTGLLPEDYYALPEQVTAGLAPGAFTLPDQQRSAKPKLRGWDLAMAVKRRRAQFMVKSEAEFYRRRKSFVAVRHLSGDRVVAIVEIVSLVSKSNRHAFQAFLERACALLERRIHLLFVDPFVPGPWEPNGIHAAIWQKLRGGRLELVADKPLTLVAYECDLTTRAHIEPVAVGDALPQMPLFLGPNDCVKVPLEATYQTAWSVLPGRWRCVLQASR